MLRRALETFRALREHAHVGMVLNNIAGNEIRPGRITEARDHLVEQLEIIAEHGTPLDEAMAYSKLGECHRLLGELDLAVDHLGRAEAIDRRYQDRNMR